MGVLSSQPCPLTGNPTMCRHIGWNHEITLLNSDIYVKEDTITTRALKQARCTASANILPVFINISTKGHQSSCPTHFLFVVDSTPSDRFDDDHFHSWMMFLCGQSTFDNLDIHNMSRIHPSWRCTFYPILLALNFPLCTKYHR